MKKRRRSSSSSSSSSSEDRHRRRKKNQKRERERSSRYTTAPSKQEKLAAAEDAVAFSAAVGDRVRGIIDLDPTAAAALSAIAQRLDNNEGVQLHAVEDSRARKKLRHFLYAVDTESIPDPISRVPTFFKKSNSKINITKICTSVLSTLPPTTTIVPTGTSSTVGEQHRIEHSMNRASSPTDTRIKSATNHSSDSTDTATTTTSIVSRPRGPALADSPEARAAFLRQLEAEDEYGPILPTGVDGDLVDKDSAQREEWMLLAPDSLAAAFGAQKKAPAVHSTIDPRKKLLQEQEQKRMAEEMAFYQKQRVQKPLSEIHRENTEKGVQLDLTKWSPEDDVWGTSAVEQHFKSKQKQLISKDKPNDGQPWRRFDRERDLISTRPASATDCEKMREVMKASSSRFGQSSFLSSNIL